jgi:WD40 repeat protein
VREEGYSIRRFQFSPDGTSLLTGAVHRATANADARVRVWDWAEGSVKSDLRGASPDLLMFDPSGDLIAEARDRIVRIWDADSGSPVTTFPAQAGDIGALAFSTDGKRIATAASDGTIRIFDVSSGLQRLVLRNPGNARSLSFSEDGSLLASVTDATLRIWALELDDLLQIARENVTRSLADEECRQYLHVEAC